MKPAPFDRDVTQAAVTAAAQAVQADAERMGSPLSYEQCEDLAITVIGHYQAFTAGVNYAATLPRSGRATAAEGQSSPEPGE